MSVFLVEMVMAFSSALPYKSMGTKKGEPKFSFFKVFGIVLKVESQTFETAMSCCVVQFSSNRQQQPIHYISCHRLVAFLGGLIFEFPFAVVI